MKIKYKGQRIMVRKLEPHERIEGIVLHRVLGYGDPNDYSGLQPTQCQGDLVSEHPEREYYKVESPFFRVY